jgi:exosortase
MTVPLTTTRSFAAAPDRDRRLLLLALAAVALAFWPTWISFPATWQSTGWHNLFVVAFCGWYAWRERARFRVGRDQLGLATVMVAGLSMTWLVATVVNIGVVHQAAVPILILAWLLATAGRQSVMAALPIAGTFFLAVPLWGALAPTLQALTAMTSGVLSGLTGIAAEIRGEYIVLDAGVLVVARGCAGLNYFEIGTFVGVVYALLFLRTWRRRVWLVALASTLAIVSNWLRVFGLVVIADVTEMQAPILHDHALYGWVIFAAMLGLFFRFARRFELAEQRESPASASGPAAEVATDPARRALQYPPLPRRTLLVPTLAAAVGPLLYLLLGSRGPDARLPVTTPGIAPPAAWTATGSAHPDTATTDWRPALRGADASLRTEWTHGSGRSATVHRLQFFSQRQGKELITEGNAIVVDSLRMGEGLAGPLDSTGRMANVTVTRVGDAPRLVWWWYQVGGSNTHSATEAKLFELIGFFTGRRASELVAVSTACDPDDRCRSASASLFTFVTGNPPPPAPNGD